MDNTLSQEWYHFLMTADNVPHAEKMVEFMDTRNRILTSKSVDSKSSHFKPSPSNTWKNFSSKMTAKGDKSKPHYALVANSTPTCSLCNEKERALYYCNKFKEMEAADRRKHISSTNHFQLPWTRTYSQAVPQQEDLQNLLREASFNAACGRQQTYHF